MEWTCIFLYLEEYFAAVGFVFGLQHVCFATITSDVIFGFHITIDSWHSCVMSCQWWYFALQFTVLICGFASVMLSFLIYSLLISFFLLHPYQIQETDEARKKFSNAKSISSAQFFGDHNKATDDAHVSLQKFSVCYLTTTYYWKNYLLNFKRVLFICCVHVHITGRNVGPRGWKYKISLLMLM